MTQTMTTTPKSAQADLIQQVNRLYHELCADRFDIEHAARHQAECIFWQKIVGPLLSDDARPAWSIVDLACGSGFVGHTLQPFLRPADRLLAIDMSEGFLKATLRRRQMTCVPLIANGQALPLADESIHLLCINAALHHLPDPAAALREIDRVLVPGGYYALGYEPNRTHFRSPLMRNMTRGLDRLRWYASPRQNRRRLRKLIGMGPTSSATIDNDDVLAETINNHLLTNGMIEQPLKTGDVLDLVDPHARDEHADQPGGFEPFALLRESLPQYLLYHLNSSDYLGLSARFIPTLRKLADVTLGSIIPRHGLLFSWLIRKPGVRKFNR